MRRHRSPFAGRPARLAALAALLAVLAAETGCVQRRLTIRSSPPGAVVYVGNQEIGTTPISHDFIYYGSRDITLVKDGFETLKVKAEIPAPWYDLPGIDFFSENVVPKEIRDHRTLDFQLQPQVIVPTEQLIGRAEELRRTRNVLATAPIALPGVGAAGQPVVPGTPALRHRSEPFRPCSREWLPRTWPRRPQPRRTSHRPVDSSPARSRQAFPRPLRRRDRSRRRRALRRPGRRCRWARRRPASDRAGSTSLSHVGERGVT